MIEKIRRALTVKYTFIIACILFLGFIPSYVAYRYNGIKLLDDGLYDYLTEELWEAKEFFRSGSGKAEIHKVNSDIKSLHNFTYWIVDKKIIHAERPADDTIAKRLEQRFLSKKYEPGKIYHENIKHKTQKWYFIAVKQNLPPDTVKNGEVFVLANYTPIRKNAKTYIKIALTAAVIIIMLAYFIGNFFVAQSMKYMEKSYEKQKQFISNVAHELRTPLTILYSSVELFEYNPRKKEIIAEIKDDILQMNNIVDKLLTIAKYDNSKMILNKERFSLNEVVSAVVKSMEHLCEKNTFHLTCSPKDFEITADKVMIRQLIGILLDNAVKYTKKDKKITIRLVKEHSQAKITVTDNGIGIKKEDLSHIFDRFWQAEKSHNKTRLGLGLGLGLGLSLADLIVSLHNGSITVKSEPGKGSVFEIILPLL